MFLFFSQDGKHIKINGVGSGIAAVVKLSRRSR